MSCRLIAILHKLLSGPCEECKVDNVEQPEDAGGVLAGGKPGMSALEFRVLLARSGLTIAAAAKLLNVTPRTISRWKSGQSQIDAWHASDATSKLEKLTPPETRQERMTRLRRTWNAEHPDEPWPEPDNGRD